MKTFKQDRFQDLSMNNFMAKSEMEINYYTFVQKASGATKICVTSFMNVPIGFQDLSINNVLAKCGLEIKKCLMTAITPCTKS